MASTQGKVSCTFHREMHAHFLVAHSALLLPQSILEDVKAAHKHEHFRSEPSPLACYRPLTLRWTRQLNKATRLP